MTPRGRRSPRGASARRLTIGESRRLLLDTQVWLWWQTDDSRLGVGARAAISGASEVRFSAVSAWEIAIKSALGKLTLPRGHDIVAELEKDGFLELPVHLSHALAVRKLPDIHRDPFDRMLVAQALSEGLSIVTGDRQLEGYSAPLLWADA